MVSTFLSNQGKIIVSPKASTWCTEQGERGEKPNLSEAERKFAKAHETKILGCWSKGVEEFSTQYNIVLQYDEKEHESSSDPVETERIIRQNLIRIFGYVTGQILSQIDFSKVESTLVDGNKEVDIEKFKTRLADAFVEDMKSSMYASTDATGSTSGKALWAEILKTEITDPVAAWQSVKADDGKSSLKSAFEDFVFAEAFDSRLCNPATRQSMESGERFAKTGDVYRPVAEFFEAMQKKLVEADGDAEKILSETEGASLTGGLALRGFFRAIFGGLFRAAGALFRGIVRVAGAVVRAVVHTVIRAAQVIARAAAFVVRWVAHVGWVIVRATVNGIAAVHNWIWYGDRYRGYYFRPEYIKISEQSKNGVDGAISSNDQVQIVAVPRSQDGELDWDKDGVANRLDQCGNTGELDSSWSRVTERPSEEKIAEMQKSNSDKYLITAGIYAGCARGQSVDFYHYREVSGYTGGAYKLSGDADEDGVEDSMDRCTNSPRYTKVYAVGSQDEFGRNNIGCASGQSVDR